MKLNSLTMVLVGFYATAAICIGIFYLNSVIPDEAKLNPSIWGTVNDWMLYGVTLITAVFFYRTLKSQMDVQKMQQKVLDIEDFKFLSSIKPQFEIRGLPPAYHAKVIKTMYHILLTGETAKDIVVSCEFKCGDNTSSKKWERKEMANGSQLNIHFDLTKESIEQEHFEIKIDITFKDIVGNRYKQYAEVIKPNRKTSSKGDRIGPSLIHRATVGE